jgi:peptidoglycan L-alanyl-D-glutamate endopeptidase CwlK
MTYTFGDRSEQNLVGVHPKMQAVVRRALQISAHIGGPDFAVIEGVRTEARQRDLYAQGRTKPGKVVTWTLKSNHFKNPRTGFGHAVDLFPGTWDDLRKFDLMAKAMFQAADELNTPIRWGADWDRDGKPRERGETDSPHFELWGV